MDKKQWKEFLATLSKASDGEKALQMADVIGSPIDIDKPYPALIDMFCDKATVSKDGDYFYFKILSPRVKQVYAIGSNGEVQLVKIVKEGLQTLTVAPLNTPVLYMPINDVLSAKGYDALATMKTDILSSMDLAELEKFFAVLIASVPVGNQIGLGTGETKFKYTHLKAMRAMVKDYANKFVLLMGSNIDEDVIGWDYDENKYRSIGDMVKDLSCELIYVGNYTLKKDGVDTAVIDPDKAFLIGMNTRLDGKPFVFARKDITRIGFKDVETDEEKQRIVQIIPTIIDISNQATAVFGYWGYEEMNVVCRLPLALAEFTRA
jgi:hypothetical protein